MALHKSSLPGPRPPGRKWKRYPIVDIEAHATAITITVPATITVGPFASKKQMLDFVAAASEGIVAHRVGESIGISITI